LWLFELAVVTCGFVSPFFFPWPACMARVFPRSLLVECADVFAVAWLCVAPALLAEEPPCFCSSAPAANTDIIVKPEIKITFFMLDPPFFLMLAAGQHANDIVRKRV